MGWILLKRALRDIKDGVARYIALSLLIIFSIFIVISLMGAALTVINCTDKTNAELRREDGEFSVFVPLREEEITKIADRGISLEKMFYRDYSIGNNKVLRVFKVRENINQIGLVEGELPKNDSEAVIERRFAEVNNYSIGSRITIGNMEFSVCGIGATPDYNNMIKKLSDTVVDSRSFGTFFVTSKSYDNLMKTNAAVASEEYYYAYLLNGAMTDEELKSVLEDNKFNVDDVDDRYFKEYRKRMTEDRDELLDGIEQLRDGASELADGAKELSDGINEYCDGVGELNDAIPELADGVKKLDDGAGALESGVRSYTSGVDKIANGSSSLASGTSSLANGASSLNQGAAQYGEGMNQFSEAYSAVAPEGDPFAPGVQGLANGFGNISSGISSVNSGANSVNRGTSQLSGGLNTLARNSGSLRNGADQLHNGTSELRKGVNELADGVSELYDATGEIRDGSAELADGAKDLSKGVDEFANSANELVDNVFEIETSNLMIFIGHDENPRIETAADDVQINLSASFIFGVLLVMLFAYVISVFIVHMIDGESSVIGALYSMGVKRRTLILSYVAVPVIVTLIASIAGTLLAITTPFGIPAQLQDTLDYYSMPKMAAEVSPLLLVYGLVIPPVTALIVNVIVIRNRLKRTPLSLLHNEQKKIAGKEIKFKGLKFLNMFRLRQMIREVRSGLTVILGMFMSLLVALMAINTYVYCSKVNDYYVSQTNFEYMYTYKYPTEEVPEGGYEAVAEDLKKEIYGYTFDITLMGITKDNPFFDTGDLPSNDTDLVLSSAVANKYNLSVGDEFTMFDKNGDRLYAFRVAKIFDFSAALMVFMDIDRVRDMFGEPDDYFNVVFSDHELDIESGRLYSTLSKSDIKKSAGIYVDMMWTMIITMSTGASVIFAVVMYLMMKMMIDRSAINISLVKIFGFRNREVRKMYLDGNFVTVALGALICIPLCKMIMDYIYPRYLVSNVGVGILPTYPPYIYLGIYVIIISLYFVINNVLVGRIRKIQPAEVLKNRE